MTTLLSLYVFLVSSFLAAGIRLTVLHINDFHAHVEQVNEELTRCRPGIFVIF